MARRTVPVKVRLVSSTRGNATEVLLFPEEREALERVCAKLTEKHRQAWGVSTFLREVALWATGDRSAAPSYVERVNEAAARVGMGPGEWMRTIALEVIGDGELTRQIGRAREGLAVGFDAAP